MSEHTPGWYPQDDGRMRYYDGSQWTNDFRDSEEDSSAPAPTKTKGSGLLSRTVSRLTQKGEGADAADVIWSAVGKSAMGIVTGRFWLTPSYLFFEHGTMRTDSQQVPISAVLDVDVRQNMGQKARGVYSVIVHIQRPQEVEEVAIHDIPNGRDAQRLINETAHQARHALQTAANTQTVRHEGTASAIAEPGGWNEAHSTHEDPIAILRQLGELRDAGVLSQEEFEAKKKEILARI